MTWVRAALGGRLVLLLCALTALLGTPQRALAQAPAGEAPAPPSAEPDAEASAREAAKVRFLRGIELAKRARWDAALAEFLASIELFPTSVARQNAALCLRELGRYAEALETYRALLADPAAKLEPSERSTVQTQVDALTGLTAELVVQSTPPGAVVVIDGEQRGTTPLAKNIVVNSGTHSLRVLKPDFLPYEAVIAAAGGQRKVLSVKLESLRQSGTLIVREAEGRVCDVSVDGAIVGKTPWQGVLPPGRHSVQLHVSAEVGSAPSLALVREQQSVSLVLATGRLDSALRVEPAPSNASVFVDGVEVGSGVWQGRLPSGRHRIELTAAAHVPESRVVELRSHERRVLAVSLERDLSNPLWHRGFAPHLALEAFGAFAWSPSLGGGADAACGTRISADDVAYDACSDRSPPLGFAVGARAAWVLREPLNLELAFGYLTLKESMTRAVSAIVEREANRAFAPALADSTSLGGPFAALSASYRVAGPLRARVLLGVMRGTVQTSNGAHYIGQNGEDDPLPSEIVIPERKNRVWIPLFGPELVAEFPLSRRLWLDVGVAALFLFPGDTPRTGALLQGEVEGRRRAEAQVGGRLRVLELPPEQALGTMLAVLPNVGVRMDF